MGTPWIIIPCYASDEQSWTPFGVDRLAQFWVISGGSEENILNQSRHSESEYQCLQL